MNQLRHTLSLRQAVYIFIALALALGCTALLGALACAQGQTAEVLTDSWGRAAAVGELPRHAWP